MMIWWRVEKFGYKIVPKEVVKETPSRVEYDYLDCQGHKKTQRESKVSSYHRYYRTEKEALDFVIERYTFLIKFGEEQLAINKEKLQEAENKQRLI